MVVMYCSSQWKDDEGYFSFAWRCSRCCILTGCFFGFLFWLWSRENWQWVCREIFFGRVSCYCAPCFLSLHLAPLYLFVPFAVFICLTYKAPHSSNVLRVGWHCDLVQFSDESGHYHFKLANPRLKCSFDAYDVFCNVVSCFFISSPVGVDVSD